MAKVYIERIKEIEKILRVEMFPMSKVRNSYQIASITSEELIRILKFIKRHDVDNGDGKWDIFDSRQTNNIAIYTQGNRLLNDGYHSFSLLKKNEETMYYPLNSNSNYIITWRLIQDFDTIGVKHINFKETWNGIESYEWFVNELLRKVNKKNVLGRIKNLRLKEFNELLGINTLQYIEYINLQEVKSHQKFCESIRLLQRFFNKNSNENV